MKWASAETGAERQTRCDGKPMAKGARVDLHERRLLPHRMARQGGVESKVGAQSAGSMIPASASVQ